jgi:hypothetical protein
VALQYFIVIASEAKQTILSLCRNMDCFAALAMTVDAVSRSRGALRPRFASWFALLEIRGRREDRVLAAPAVSRAICANKNCTRAYRAAGTLRPSLRNGFTAYFVLSPENGSFASVIPKKLRFSRT